MYTLLVSISSAWAADVFVDVRPRVDAGVADRWIVSWSRDGRFLLVEADGGLRVYDAVSLRVVRERPHSGINGRVSVGWPGSEVARVAGCTFDPKAGEDRCWIDDWDLASNQWTRVADLGSSEPLWVTPDGTASIITDGRDYLRYGEDERYFPIGRASKGTLKRSLANEVFGASADAEYLSAALGNWFATARAGDSAPTIRNLPEDQVVLDLTVLSSGDTLALVQDYGEETRTLQRFPKGSGPGVQLLDVGSVVDPGFQRPNRVVTLYGERSLFLSPDESELMIRRDGERTIVLPLDHPDDTRFLGDSLLASVAWGPTHDEVAGSTASGIRVFRGGAAETPVVQPTQLEVGGLAWLTPEQDRSLGGAGVSAFAVAASNGGIWRMDPTQGGPGEMLREHVTARPPYDEGDLRIVARSAGPQVLLVDVTEDKRVSLPAPDRAAPLAWTVLPEANEGGGWSWSPHCGAYVSTFSSYPPSSALSRLFDLYTARSDVSRVMVPADGRPVTYQPIGSYWDTVIGPDGAILARSGGRRRLIELADDCVGVTAVPVRLPPKVSIRFEEDGRLLAVQPDGHAFHFDPRSGVREALPFVKFATGWERDRVEPLARRQKDGSWATVAALEISESDTARLYDLRNGRALGDDLITGDVQSITASPDGRFQILTDQAGVRTILDLDRMAVVGWLYVLQDGGWAVVDSDGRFDTSDPSVWSRLYYVRGLEPIGLEQIGHRYYEPGLLARLLSLNSQQPPDVIPLRDAPLPPEVTHSLPSSADPWLRVTLTPRSGGLGRVVVRVDANEITSDLRAEKDVVEQTRPDGQVDLAWPRAALDAWVEHGGRARVDVVAFGTEEWISSKNTDEVYDDVTAPSGPPPRLYALVVGVEDYPGGELDLHHPVADAEAMAMFLKSGGGQLYRDPEVHVLAVGADAEARHLERPTAANLARELQWLSETRPQDVVVVFLSGHGMAAGTPRDFFFLTSDATKARVDAIDDAASRAAWTLSGSQLQRALRKIKAHKAVILDTCHSGEFTNGEAGRDPIAERALTDLERTAGSFVLAGSSGDGRSYESAVLGHGVLTWSLLRAMQSPADAAETWDVLTLFGQALKEAADQARRLGVQQQPQIRTVAGGTFDLGRSNTELKAITLAAPRPVYTRSSFQEEGAVPVDGLRLSWKVDGALAQLRARDALAWYPGEPRPGVRQIAGRYTVSEGTIRLTAHVLGEKTERSRDFTRPIGEVEALATDIAAWAAGGEP